MNRRLQSLLVFSAIVTFGCNGILLTPIPNSPNALGSELRHMELGTTPTSPPRLATMVVCNLKAELGLNLRSDVGTNAAVLDVLPNGTEVALGEKKTSVDGGIWFEVTVGNVTGWVNGRYLCRP